MDNCKKNWTETWVGADLKFRVTIASPGFDQDTDDWSVTIVNGTVTRTFAKADCTHNLGGWYLCFSTSTFGPGQYTATITAHVPDTDFPDGTREEVKKVTLPPVKP